MRNEETKKPAPYVIVENYPYNTQRRSAQRVRVFRSRWLLVDDPEAHQHVELVGERDRDRHRIGRDEIGRALRPVMVLDRVGDRLVLALGLGIIFAHRALQLRELAGQPDNAFDALGLGAELLVEDNLI